MTSRLDDLNESIAQEQLFTSEATAVMEGEREKNLHRIRALCYEVFIRSKEGKELMDLLHQEWMTYERSRPGAQGYNETAIHEAGQLSFLRTLKNHALFYKYRNEVKV